MLPLLRNAGYRAVLRHASLLPSRTYIGSTRASSTVAQLLSSHAKPRDSAQHDTVTLNGFVRTVRKQKRVAFAAVGDGTSLDPVQVVLTPEQGKDLSNGVAVQITGQWQASPAGKEQSHELLATHVRVLGENDAESYPIQKKYQSPDFLRTLPHLRPRIPYNSLLLRLRSEAIRYATEFFSKNGYVQTHPPIITSSDCEGAGEVFTINDSSSEKQPKADEERFFRAPKYLTVSSQLHLEALAQAVDKVWTLSPTFRAEHSDTPRHLSEFYMLEAEACFVENLDEVMDVVEGLLKAIVHGLHGSPISEQLLWIGAKKQIEEESDSKPVDLKARWDGMISRPWPRITYTEAIGLLHDATARKAVHFEHLPQLGSDLKAEHEKYLAETIGCGSPVFVTDYPRDIKAFYMAPTNIEQAQGLPTVACFDLLVPDVCEIVGGSMREHRMEPLLQAMERHGMLDPAQGTTQDLASAVPGALQWYVDLRRYGSVPHGGFGLGFDRLLCYLSGVSSIRDMASFPRWYGRCDC